MATTETTFLQRVRERAGLGSDAEAERATHTVLQVLGSALTAEDARWLASQLPQALRQHVGQGEQLSLDRDQFHQRVAARAGVDLPFAVEHVQVVCSVVAEHLDPSLLARLRQRVPETLVELFEPAPERSARSPSSAEAADRKANPQRLATARPGSEQPLSQASPLVGTRPLSEAGENPRHLSQARPGSSQPLSEARPKRSPAKRS